MIEHSYARSTVAAYKNGAVYMVIRNEGNEPERLLTVQSGGAQRTGLHSSSITADGVAQMRPVGAVDIPPGGKAPFAPGGLYIMLERLQEPWIEGTLVPVTLVFEPAGEIPVEVQVESLHAASPRSDHQHASSGMTYNAHTATP